MSIQSVTTHNHVKRTGAHFTPKGLASFVAQRIIATLALESYRSLRVLDPACGDGELLSAFADAIPKDQLPKISLHGVESDLSSVIEARKRLAKLLPQASHVQEGDFLHLVQATSSQLSLFHEQPSFDLADDPVDVIIANPPYVRTQVLGTNRAQELAAAFDLQGRVDLYHAFLVAMTQCLAPGGILGVITSNKFLTTKGGASVRGFLNREYDVIEIFDLGDTKLFEAAVLPAIFVGRRRDHTVTSSVRGRQTRFMRIYEESRHVRCVEKPVYHAPSVYAALTNAQDGRYQIGERYFEVATGSFSIPNSSAPWQMTTTTESHWLQIVNSRSHLCIADVAKVRVGIKTCADNVFIRTDWDTLDQNTRPEKELLHRLLSHDDAKRWTRNVEARPKYIVYPHESKNGKRVVINLTTYPGAAAYFEGHYEQLNNRRYVLQAGRQWFEIWVPQDPSLWTRPKVVFPDISAEPKFFFDDQGFLVDGNCYWITLDDKHDLDLLFLIQAVANSKLMTQYHDASFHNKLYAGRRRYLTQYVERYPLPDPDSALAQRLISLAKDLVYHSEAEGSRVDYESEIEAALLESFGIH